MSVKNKPKWHKEIKAWSDGKRIQRRKGNGDWVFITRHRHHWETTEGVEYRIVEPEAKKTYTQIIRESLGLV